MEDTGEAWLSLPDDVLSDGTALDSRDRAVPKYGDDEDDGAARQARYAEARPKKKWHRTPASRLKKNQKAAIFLEWLVKTFDLERRGRGYACMQCGLLERPADPTSALFSDSFHVVDVAGGRGQLAFYLSAFYSVPTSVIDPAPMNLARFENQFAKKQAAVKRMQQAEKQRETSGDDTAEDDTQTSEKNEFVTLSATSAASLSPCTLCPPRAASSSPPPTSASNAAAVPSPFTPSSSSPVAWLSHLRHFRCMFPSSIALSVHKNHARPPSKACCDDELEEEDEAADEDSQTASASFPLSSPASSPAAAALLSTELASVLASCSLLYGMHSDGATEALVDYALAHDKPFAVVPCCVFPSAAPHRRVRRDAVQTRPDAKQQARMARNVDGDATDAADPAALIPVRTYEQFLAYLQAKHPAIERVDLAFEGRNTVLFRRSTPVEQ